MITKMFQVLLPGNKKADLPDLAVLEIIHLTFPSKPVAHSILRMYRVQMRCLAVLIRYLDRVLQVLLKIEPVGLRVHYSRIS